MRKATHDLKLARNRTIEAITRTLICFLVLVSLLATTQACRTSSPQDETAKEETVLALTNFVAKLVADRPEDATAYAQQLKSYLETNPAFYGAAAVLLDENQNIVASPYVYRTSNGFEIVDLATPDYGIENQAWFYEPLSQDKGIWTDPYFDSGGGEIWMITYAVPVRNAEGTFAILTTDLPSDAPSD